MAVTARFGGLLGPTGRGAGDASITVRFNANELISLANRTGGKFAGGSFQRALTAVHERASTKIQEGMVDRLNRAIHETGRVQRGGERLATALMHEENRTVSAGGFVVGRPYWLDRSPAKLYYRRIEEGDQKTFDAKILFTNDFSKFVGPYSPGGRHGRGYSSAQPVGYKHMRMPQHRGAFVQNIGPFPAYRYSQGGVVAFRRFDMLANYTATLSAIGIPMEQYLKSKK